MRSIASPPPFFFLLCKALPCLSFRACREIFITVRCVHRTLQNINITDEQCSSLRIERSDMKRNKCECVAHTYSLFTITYYFNSGAGVPAHSSLFTILSSLWVQRVYYPSVTHTRATSPHKWRHEKVCRLLPLSRLWRQLPSQWEPLKG